MVSDIGNRLKRLRKNKKFSLRALGKAAHVSHSFIADIEAGRSKPSLDTLMALARALGVSISDITGDVYLVAESPYPYVCETKAAHRTDDPMADLPDEARRSLDEFMEKYLLPQRLKSLREGKCLSQYDLAKALGYSHGQIANYEQGTRKPDPDTLQRLADFFGCSVDYLLGRTDDPNATLQNSNQQTKSKDLQKFLDQQEIMFDGVPLTEDDKEKIRKALELIFWDAKQKNKRKKS